MLGSLDVSRSALNAHRVRMDVIAGNIANAFTTGRDDGTIAPFQRRFVTLASGRAEDGGPGVQLGEVLTDQAAPRLKWDPGHPHALPDGPSAGYVQYPNVSLTLEYVDALAAQRAYEANLAMMNLTKSMIQQTLQALA